MRTPLKNAFGSQAMLAAAAVMIAAPFLQAQPANNPAPQKSISEQVRHALVTIPWVNVFDDLSYRVDGSTVTLFGQVTRPIIKSDAGNSVKNIEGVTKVNNEIEVLPVSQFDNEIRWHEAYAIFGYQGLQRYAMGTQPSIRIIVKNGHVTLKGYVNSEMDKQLVYMRARQVANVFSVTNELQVAKS
ncbi:MAG: BON domain-containing protein [Bryobacteraceae bacterium]